VPGFVLPPSSGGRLPSEAPIADKVQPGKGKGTKRASLRQESASKQQKKQPAPEEAAPEKPAPKESAKKKSASEAPIADKVQPGKGKGTKRASLRQVHASKQQKKQPAPEEAAPEKPAPKEPAPEEPAKKKSASKGPARPEIVVLTFHNSDLAADYAPVSSEELLKLKDAPVTDWPINVELARAFSMEATRATYHNNCNHNTSYLVPS